MAITPPYRLVHPGIPQTSADDAGMFLDQSGDMVMAAPIFDLGGAAFNIKHPKFSVVGDGVADDTVAIQKVIDAVPIGGTLVVPSGTYVLSRQFSETFDWWGMVGGTYVVHFALRVDNDLSIVASPGAIFKLTNSVNLRWVDTIRHGACYLSIQNLQFETSGTELQKRNTEGVKSIGISSTAPARLKLQDCRFLDFFYAWAPWAWVYDSEVQGCRFLNEDIARVDGGSGIVGHDVKEWRSTFIHDNLFETATGKGDGVTVNSPGTIHATWVASDIPQEIHVARNIFRGYNGAAAVGAAVDFASCYNSSITDNTAFNCRECWHLEDAGPGASEAQRIENITISGNRSLDTVDWHVALTSGTYKRILIANNVGVGGKGATVGTELPNDGEVVLQGNYFRTDDPTNDTIGINVVGDTANLNGLPFIVGNTLEGFKNAINLSLTSANLTKEWTLRSSGNLFSNITDVVFNQIASSRDTPLYWESFNDSVVGLSGTLMPSSWGDNDDRVRFDNLHIDRQLITGRSLSNSSLQRRRFDFNHNTNKFRTVEQGDYLFAGTPDTFGSMGRYVKTKGTYGSFSAGRTGNVTNGQPSFVVTNTAEFHVGMYISIAGSSLVYRVTKLISSTITVDQNADVTDTTAAITMSNPVTKLFGLVFDLSSAYTRNAAVVEDRTLLASASATTINNNNVLAALIIDLQTTGVLG